MSETYNKRIWPPPKKDTVNGKDRNSLEKFGWEPPKFDCKSFEETLPANAGDLGMNGEPGDLSDEQFLCLITHI